MIKYVHGLSRPQHDANVLMFLRYTGQSALWTQLRAASVT